MKVLRRKSLGLLKTLVDPDDDCTLVADADTNRITIEVPGRLHSLAPQMTAGLDKKKPLHNAPFAVTEVEGAFLAMVELTGEMRPGSALPKDRQGNSIPFTFQGAGLLLYQDKDNFVRLERTAGVDIDTLQAIHKVLFEVVKEGKPLKQSYLPVPEGPVCLSLGRREGRVFVGTSPDVDAPIKSLAEVDLDLPAKVKIGVSASNISAKPFTATFDNFTLVTEGAMIDALFGESKK
jgi:hypothetical protein